MKYASLFAGEGDVVEWTPFRYISGRSSIIVVLSPLSFLISYEAYELPKSQVTTALQLAVES